MKKEELLTLKEGTLIKIKGVDFWGRKVDTLKVLKKDNIAKSGLLCGGVVYPFEWVKKPTKKDLEKLCEQVRKNAEDLIAQYCHAFELLSD